MLERVSHDNGVVFYRSPKLAAMGLPHAFSTRVGGVSKGRFASLNLGTLAKGEGGDSNAMVAANFRLLRDAVGCQRIPRVEVRQVHGCGVWVPDADIVHPRAAPEADGLVSTRPRQLLTIRTADCVPLLMASDDGKVIAAVHAGWRGVVAGVVPEAVRTMVEQCNVSAERVIVAIGPHISVDHFEVGPEVAAEFDDVDLGPAVVRDNGHRPHVDMLEAVLLQLDRVGVIRDNIDVTDCCTYADAETFFSHRRDGPPTGRMAAIIMRP
ncbi:peptidoglycan editing factor PgeF [Phycisphaerales bacterium AB-hyl4]|uniref:Purine nucleoside phosphorylase n=1 Tax=Natronomicrosphaera hydrolytica TaxID=3242702 RepID=A0ABV4U5I5_9BACT